MYTSALSRGNVSIFLIGKEASRPMRDSNTLKSFLNPRQEQAWFGRMDYSGDTSWCPQNFRFSSLSIFSTFNRCLSHVSGNLFVFHLELSCSGEFFAYKALSTMMNYSDVQIISGDYHHNIYKYVPLPIIVIFKQSSNIIVSF